MIDVKILIVGKDRRVGAMVKALAVEVAGFTAVTGATLGFLSEYGFYLLHFPSLSHAEDFNKSVSKYLPETLATVTGAEILN